MFQHQHEDDVCLLSIPNTPFPPPLRDGAPGSHRQLSAIGRRNVCHPGCMFSNPFSSLKLWYNTYKVYHLSHILKWGRCLSSLVFSTSSSCAANLQNSLHLAELRLFTHRCILSSHSPWQIHSTFCLYEFVYSECLIEDTVLSLCDWFISLSMMSS